MDVQLSGVTKRFGSFCALDGVSFSADKGAIHAIVGENGAGKTTLMRVLYGGLRPDAGSVVVDGQQMSFRNSAEALRAGIGMVSQHYSIIPELTCLQNLMLGAEPGWFIDSSAAEHRARELATSMGYEFDWNREAAELSPAGRQKLEILKLLWREAKVMVLDEPTAMLSPLDSDQLFASLRELAQRGANVIVVTHRLPEVIEHCATVTVLRGGKLVTAKPVSETDATELAEAIVGHAVPVPVRGSSSSGSETLVVRSLTVVGYRGDNAVDGLDLSVRAGELLGLAGVDGNGQRELFQALVGTLRPSGGEILWSGSPWAAAGPSARIRAGLRLIPEDRHAEGVVDDWPLTENAVLGLQRMPPYSRGPWVDEGEKSRASERIAARFATKHSGFGKPMRSLSGGNQQRFVAARALEGGPKLILAFQPTRGLDIDGTAQVYQALRDECARGACALVVSFDLDELLENCDRVVAVSHGKILSPPAGQERDRAAIGRLMVGAA